jgi:hypothetical protein
MPLANEFIALPALVEGGVLASTTKTRHEFMFPETTCLAAQRANERHLGRRGCDVRSGELTEKGVHKSVSDFAGIAGARSMLETSTRNQRFSSHDGTSCQ